MTKVGPALVAVALGCGATIAAAEPPPTLEVVLARAGDYVLRFERDLSSIVSEERYVQDVTGGKVSSHVKVRVRHRELKSDLLLLRPAGANEWVQFRDVFEVDGKPVRDRDDRLAKLFLKPSRSGDDQIHRITAESARYNIGSVERTINVPVLPLMALDPAYQPRFEFTRAENDAQDRGDIESGLPASPRFKVSTEVWVIAYREVRANTIVKTREHRDMPMTGRFWIEPDTGRVLMSELVGRTPDVDAKINVSYQSVPLLGMLVPIEMHELYASWRDSTRIEGTAEYGDFRRFQVSTDEKVRQRN